MKLHPMHTSVVKHYVNRCGKRCVVGGPGLKATQSYSKVFGATIARLHRGYTIKEHLKDKARSTVSNNLLDVNVMADTWADAKLLPVTSFVRRRAGRRSDEEHSAAACCQ